MDRRLGECLEPNIVDSLAGQVLKGLYNVISTDLFIYKWACPILTGTLKPSTEYILLFLTALKC